jgi:hypothetical protein
LLKEYQDEIQGLNSEQLNQKSEGGNWSIAEIIYHISHAEKSNRPVYTEKAKQSFRNKKGRIQIMV